MDFGQVLLGLAGIALGYQSLAKGATRLAGGLSNGGGSSRIPTVRVPRSATRAMPRIHSQSKRVATKAGPMQVTLREVNSLGDRLSVIIDKAHQGKIDPYVIAWARREVSNKDSKGQWVVPEKDTEAEAFAIFKGMRRSIRYTSDVRGYDTYANPRKTLKARAGDCDEYTAVGCAALMAIGIPCRIEVIETKASAAKGTGPDHVFVQAKVPRGWVSLDASVNMPPGWRAPDSMIARRWIFETE